MKFPIEWAFCELSTAILKFSMGKIFIGREFWMHVKKIFREWPIPLLLWIRSTKSVDYVLGKNFDGTFFGDNNPKCAAVHMVKAPVFQN